MTSIAHDSPATQLDALREVLSSAHEVLFEILEDPLVERVLRVFARLAERDRESILGVLERDATWCRIVEETSAATGITVRPNPHASLYVQVLSQTSDPPSEPLRRDIDVIRFGIERFVQLIPLLFQEGVHAQWMASARELVRAADPELRGYGARLAREVLALIAEVEDDPGPTLR